MNIFEFLRYWMDNHIITFGLAVLLICGGIAGLLSSVFSKGHDHDHCDCDE